MPPFRSAEKNSRHSKQIARTSASRPQLRPTVRIYDCLKADLGTDNSNLGANQDRQSTSAALSGLFCRQSSQLSFQIVCPTQKRLRHIDGSFLGVGVQRVQPSYDAGRHQASAVGMELQQSLIAVGEEGAIGVDKAASQIEAQIGRCHGRFELRLIAEIHFAQDIRGGRISGVMVTVFD